MAKKAKAAGNEETVSPAIKKAKLMGLLGKVGFGLHLIAITGLFAGIFDFQVVNLVPVLAKFAGIFLVLEIIAIILSAFAGGQVVSAQREISDEKYDKIKIELEDRMTLVGGKVEEYLGENYKNLKEENEKLHSEFETIKENANNKILEDLETLKTENADLRKKLESRFTGGNEAIIEQEEELQVA